MEDIHFPSSLPPEVQLIRELCDLHGVSSSEGEVVEYLKNRFPPEVKEVVQDNLGSTFAYLPGKASHPKNMLISAHSDEVGFMVSAVDNEGLLHLKPLGGYQVKTALGNLLAIKTAKGEYHYGTVVHPMKPPLEESLLCDTGCSSPAMVKQKGIEVGDTVTTVNQFTYDPHSRTIFSKALDNRACCALIVELTQHFSNTALLHHCFLGATVQEELGLRGSKTACHLIKPDFSLVLECSPVDDRNNPQGVALGKGPLIRVADKSMVSSRPLVQLLKQLAQKEEIPYQLFISQGGTDAIEIQTHQSGVLSCVLCIPCRYMHTGCSMIHLDDYSSTLTLAKALISHLQTPHSWDLLVGFS